jgi:hypothetical protein
MEVSKPACYIAGFLPAYGSACSVSACLPSSRLHATPLPAYYHANVVSSPLSLFFFIIIIAKIFVIVFVIVFVTVHTMSSYISLYL